MKIALKEAQLARLREELAAEGTQGEHVIDAYEPEPAFTVEFEFIEGGIDVLAAAFLKYDAEMDGWYMGERIEEADALARLIEEYLDS